MKLKEQIQSINILNKIAIGVIIVNQNDEIIFINQRGKNELKICEEEAFAAEGQKLTDLVGLIHEGKESFPPLKKTAEQHNGEAAIPENTFLYLKKKNSSFPVSGAISSLSADEKDPNADEKDPDETAEKGYILYFRDSTEEVTRNNLLQTAVSQTKIFPWSFEVDRQVFTLEPRYFTYTGIPAGSGNTVSMQQFLDLLHPDEKDAVTEAFSKQLGRSTAYNDPVSFRIRRGDGTWEWFKARSLRFVEKQSGRPYRLIGLCMSIQEYKNAEALRVKMYQTEESDQLKSAFIANMSHEIRTPLNAIVGFSDLLMNCTDPQEKAAYMRLITANNELLLKVINDILDLSKIETGTPHLKYERFNLTTYFEGLMASMKHWITKPQVVLQSVVAHWPVYYVTLDKNRFAQILSNYVSNAIKYTPEGRIETGYEQTAEGIRLFVRDSGIGIADDKKDRIFRRFDKLDEFAQGTGLGLSICKAVAESMGGKVGFTSTPGKGSEFWALLPCKVEIQHKTKRPAKTDKTPPVTFRKNEQSGPPLSGYPSRKTILVAEDTSSNYLLLEALLQKEYRLLHAEDGLKAVELAKNNAVHLILMDLKMPRMNGVTATAEIRKFNPDVPIVALTAYIFEVNKEAALKAGCNAYMEKPLNKNELMNVLKKYV